MPIKKERKNEEIKSVQAEIRAAVNAIEAKLDTLIADMKDGRKERMACQESTETNPEKMKPNPGIMQSIGEHQVVLKEGAVVRSSGALKKRHRGRHLAAGSRQRPKETTW
jgi:hypothetical protein